MQTVDQLSSLLLSIISMQSLKRIDQTCPNFLLYLRIFFLVSIITNLILLYIIKKRINIVNDKRTIKIKKQKSFFDNEEDEEEIEMSHFEFDMNEYNNNLKRFLIQTVFILLGHWKWKMCQPLLVQGIAPFKAVFLCPLYVCYLRGKDILRPYELNMLFEGKKVVKVESKKKED